MDGIETELIDKRKGRTNKKKKRQGKKKEKEKKQETSYYYEGPDQKTGSIPVELVFNDITYKVKAPKSLLKSIKSHNMEEGEFENVGNVEDGNLVVLNGVSGVIRPRTMTALLGATGAGKTSLLNILAGRISFGRKGSKSELIGRICLNGYERNEGGFAKIRKKRQAYVMQDDLLLKTQTPKEILNFSGNMKLLGRRHKQRKFDDSSQVQQKKWTRKLVAERVTDISEKLNLVDCMCTQVGAPGGKRGISGGERKRVGLALEMVGADPPPSLLLLDEPTTGLDSRTAEVVIDRLKHLAHNEGMTILATLHQPSDVIYHSFDNVIVLAKGRIVYQGPVSPLSSPNPVQTLDESPDNNNASNALEYFDKVLKKPCAQFANPADHFIRVVHVDQADGGVSKKRVSGFCDTWETSPQRQSIDDQITNCEDMWHSVRQGKGKGSHQLENVTVKETHSNRDCKSLFFFLFRIFVMFREMMLRHWRDLFRNPMTFAAPTMQSVLLSSFIGMLYFNGDLSQSGTQDLLGAFFFVLINQAMSSIFGVVNTFTEDKFIYLRENAAGLYPIWILYFVKFLGDFPFFFLRSALYSTITYWMILGFDDGSILDWINVFLQTFVTAEVLSGFGLFVAIAAPSVDLAMVAMPLALLPLMLFSGFYINSGNIPGFLSWIQHISPVRYGFESTVSIIFHDTELHCTESEFLNLNGTKICPMTNGDQLLERLEFSYDNIWFNFGILLIMDAVIRLFSILVFLFKVKRFVAE